MKSCIQKEKRGISKSYLDASGGKLVTYVRGRMIGRFREGWAYNIFMGGRVSHYYKRDDFSETTRSACSLSTSKERWMYRRGSYPQCKHCLRIVVRK